MSDNDKTTTEGALPGDATVPERAKVGRDDYGKTVTTAAGELFSGTVSDITDGDTHRKKHK